MHTAQQILEIEATLGWQSEDAMQAAYYQLARNTYQLHGLLFSVPNGGSRNKIEGAKLKATGTTAGIPDLILLAKGRAIGIELKLPNGTVSKEQKEIHVIWGLAGCPVTVVRDFNTFIALIMNAIS